MIEWFFKETLNTEMSIVYFLTLVLDYILSPFKTAYKPNPSELVDPWDLFVDLFRDNAQLSPQSMPKISETQLYYTKVLLPLNLFY